MCRLSSEVFVAAGGSGVLASVATFAKAHWDAIKDRKAFKAARERQEQQTDEPSTAAKHAEGD